MSDSSIDVDRLKKRFRGLARADKVLVVIAAFFLVVSVGFYGWVTFSSTTIRQSSLATPYQWNGDRLLLYTDSDRQSGSCTVAPAKGEVRAVNVPIQSPRRFAAARFTQLRPWFQGSATIKSTHGDVKVWHGAAARWWLIVSSLGYKVVSVILVVIPLVIVILRSGARRRRPVRDVE